MGRSGYIYYVDVWPRRIWEVCNRTNHRQDVRAGNDFTRKLFSFSRNDPSRSTVNPLIATIAYKITWNLPDVRNAVLEAIERDPLIFSKSLAVQVKSLIVTPLQSLAGFFNGPTSRRLVTIDGLYECSEPKVQ
jgi:hypothetical protein